MGAFFRQQQAEAAASHWQLIQLAPTNQPGSLSVILHAKRVISPHPSQCYFDSTRKLGIRTQHKQQQETTRTFYGWCASGQSDFD